MFGFNDYLVRKIVGKVLVRTMKQHLEFRDPKVNISFIEINRIAYKSLEAAEGVMIRTLREPENRRIRIKMTAEIEMDETDLVRLIDRKMGSD